MLHLLKRHPLPVKAFLRRSLVLTYAFSRELLEPLLAPGLALDTLRGKGFLAIALVQTENLRPGFLPAACGGNFFLSGYRLFVRLGNAASSLRGLQILRSYSDRGWMVAAGNLLTHYRYRLCHTQVNESPGQIEWTVQTRGQKANLHVIMLRDQMPAHLPLESPFEDEKESRRFAGPLPCTFDYECQTNSIIRIQAIRQNWHPIPVRAEVLQNTFLHQPPFCRARPVLAAAFYVHDVSYQWARGIRTSVEAK